MDVTVVRAQPDGVHIVMDASEDVAGAEAVRGSSPQDLVAVGLSPHEDGVRGIYLAPSTWSVGCYSGRRGSVDLVDIGSDKVAAFRVIDPDHLYEEWTLDCDNSTISTIDVAGSVPGEDQDWNSIVADSGASIPGLLPRDQVRNAGYPEGQPFKDGPHPVVVRDGSVIATLQFQEFAAEGGAWSFVLDACDDSGLG